MYERDYWYKTKQQQQQQQQQQHTRIKKQKTKNNPPQHLYDERWSINRNWDP